MVLTPIYSQEIRKAPRSELQSIIDFVQINLEEGFSIKDMFPKVEKRFNGESWTIYQKFPIYRLMCNLFENAVIEGTDPEEFRAQILLKVAPLEEASNLEILNRNPLKDGMGIYKGIRDYLGRWMMEELMDILKKSRDPKLGLSMMTLGRKKLLSLYLSNVSLLYGMRKIPQKYFIFYYQPYYCDFHDLGRAIRLLCVKHLEPDFNIVLSFRYISDSYKDKLNINGFSESFGKVGDHFNKFYVSCLENAYNKDYIINHKVFYNAVLDDTADMGD